MQSTVESSSATMDKNQIIDQTLEQTRELALQEAAEKEMKVSEIQDVQREKIQQLFHAKGSDGLATKGGKTSIPQDIQTALDKGIAQQHQDRMKAVAPTPDAYVLPDDSTIVGVQHDDTREIGIAGRALHDDRVAKHEAKHREQEIGDQYVDLPPTGDPEIDEIRQLSRRALRENGAVKAEGGLKNHTPEYHEYVQSSDRIAQYLDQNGFNGDQMVEKAGDTNAGFDELHQSMVVASMQQRLAEEMSNAERAHAA